MKPHPLPGNQLAIADFGSESSEDMEKDNLPVKTNSIDAANIITSAYICMDDSHRPVLDLDFGASLVESSTPGHFHLFLDFAMPWGSYKKLLDVMAEVGLLQPGYVAASKHRGYTAVRLPWIKKEAKQAETLDGGERCLYGENVYFELSSEAAAPGHIYSADGLREFAISRCCEYHFDLLFAEKGDDE